MHDPQYRVGIANQNVVYNQPAYPSFYLASDIDWAKVPVPDIHAPRASNPSDREVTAG
jgi:hypothetical protein